MDLQRQTIYMPVIKIRGKNYIKLQAVNRCVCFYVFQLLRAAEILKYCCV